VRARASSLGGGGGGFSRGHRAPVGPGARAPPIFLDGFLFLQVCSKSRFDTRILLLCLGETRAGSSPVIDDDEMLLVDVA
jgi:hypothetical protein